jgi:hypothetical protein
MPSPGVRSFFDRKRLLDGSGERFAVFTRKDSTQRHPRPFWIGFVYDGGYFLAVWKSLKRLE